MQYGDINILNQTLVTSVTVPLAEELDIDKNRREQNSVETKLLRKQERIFRYSKNPDFRIT